jgi:hypothetical protein
VAVVVVAAAAAAVARPTLTRQTGDKNSHEGAARVNLKWKGHHEISDFDFSHLGDVIGCGTKMRDGRSSSFHGIACSQLAARIAIRSYDPPIVSADGCKRHFRP